jgi:transcriptional regulator with XRE-family HTH domain
VKSKSLQAVFRHRAAILGKSFTELAAEAGLTRTYLYKLIGGGTADPSVRTLVRLASALELAPVTVLEHFVDLDVARPRSSKPKFGTSRANGLLQRDDTIVFHADVTIPDHAVVGAGETFQKVWEVRNAGRTPWEGRRLVRVDREFIITQIGESGTLEPVLQAHLASVQRDVSIPVTPPGACARVEVGFVAPQESCSVVSIWRIRDKLGRDCYPASFFLQVIVNVIE